MSRRHVVALTLAALLLAACGRSERPGSGDGDGSTPPPLPTETQVKAGVGVVDMTPDVGYCAGQYCDYASDTLTGLLNGDVDPFLTHKLKFGSYGVQSRLTARAIVVEGSDGKRVALLKTDNYIAQDMLLRRVGQLLEKGSSGIGYEQILYHVSHNHSSAYASTLAVGLFIFQDVFDARFFENQARKMAEAIEQAAANLKPARMGATEVHHRVYKGNVVRLATANDGTPAGYPLEYGDHGLVLIRFDDLSDPQQPKPLAAWVNWGEHPESLDAYNLHSADYLAPLERFVERGIGAPLLFSQGDVGSAENSGDAKELLSDTGEVCGEWPGDAEAPLRDDCPEGEGTLRDWNHRGYVQTERNVRFLADAIHQAWEAIGRGEAKVPMSGNFTVDYRNAWVPGPLSHPIPTVSNCSTELTVEGDIGVPVAGLPDCGRYGVPGETPLSGPAATLYATLKAEGVPVPDHYSGPGFAAVEENLRLKLQAFRLGDILLASCACEPQADLVLNLESRLDDSAGNIYDGFDWACLLPDFAGDPAYAQACAVQQRYFDPADSENRASEIAGDNFDPAAIAHVRAQVHNDARGWDDAANALSAETEPAETAAIKGNFTREEIQDLGAPGYKLAVAVGHAGDYNGYTVSYREYMSRDSYRKALTAYGPHTADYMVTRLVRLGAALQGGPELAPEPLDLVATVDETRQQAQSLLIGQLSGAAYEAWQAGMPNDVGPAEPVQQPTDISRFAATQFVWRGGSTAADNPRVRVERETAPDVWEPYADQSGEVPVRVQFPQGLFGLMQTYAGMQEWLWTASFEAYSAFPARLGSTPLGRYRFCVEGNIRQSRADAAYDFCSEPFTVSAWDGIAVAAPSRSGDSYQFPLPAITYPRSYAEGFRYIADNDSPRLCDSCSFRPWAQHGRAVRAELEIVNGGNGARRSQGASCDSAGQCRVSATSLASGEQARLVVYDADGNRGSVALP